MDWLQVVRQGVAGCDELKRNRISAVENEMN